MNPRVPGCMGKLRGVLSVEHTELGSGGQGKGEVLQGPSSC